MSNLEQTYAELLESQSRAKAEQAQAEGARDEIVAQIKALGFKGPNDAKRQSKAMEKELEELERAAEMEVERLQGERRDPESGD